MEKLTEICHSCFYFRKGYCTHCMLRDEEKAEAFFGDECFYWEDREKIVNELIESAVNRYRLRLIRRWEDEFNYNKR